MNRPIFRSRSNSCKINSVQLFYPMWVLLTFPHFFLLSAVGYFAIYNLVVWGAILVLRVPKKSDFYKRNIFWVTFFGLLSNLLGIFLMYLLARFTSLGEGVGDEPLLTVPGVILSAICIFLFNLFYFRKEDLKIRLTMAVSLAVVSAPYVFLVPNSWIYTV